MLLKNLNKLVPNDLKFYIKNRQFNKIFIRAISTSKVSRIYYSHEEFVVKSQLPSLTYPNLSIDQYIWKDIGKWTDKVAIVDAITDRSITYADLRDKCRALAIRLRTTPILQPKDTVAICLPNSIEFPIVALGACEADLVVTTVNPTYTSEEISNQLIDSNAKVLFGDASMSKILKEAVQKTNRSIKIIYVTKYSNEPIPADGIRFNELIDTKGLDFASLPEIEPNINGVSFLPYSSGTTGLNKGVMLSHKNIVSNCVALRGEELKIASDSIGGHQDILPCVLPFFHVYGLVVTLFSKLAQGCKLISLPRFQPDTFLDAMEKYQGNVLHLVPPIIIFFNNYDRIRPEHTRSIHYVACGAAPLGNNDVMEFLKIAPQAKFIQAYGLSESSPVTHMMRKSSTNYGSIGNPIYDTEAKIVDTEDPEFRGIGPKRIGELLIRGPQVMLGYLNNESATRDAITSDGWLRTGDIGYHDENGEFFITDRLKELIKVNGFQVAPAELEEILRTHPEIRDAAVIGIPNSITGELPRAFVVKSKDSQLTEKNVQDFVSDKVTRFKRLTGGVEFIDTIPKNATGKILRKNLKKKYN